MKTIKQVTCTVVIGLTLLAQLITPTRAYADGETPPPPAETADPTEEPTEWTPNEKPFPPKTSTEAPATETQTPTTLPEILEQISSETNVVALDENWQPLPLATQEAAAVVTTGDPVWCPAGQTPTPGSNGCTVSYLTLADLVAAEGGTIAADGTIWITTGIVTDISAVTIDGSTYTTWANYELTLQGGWDGIAGSTTISSNSVFSVPIAINTWVGNVTINNLTVQNTNDTGLSVVTEGTITTHNIIANGNANNGAYLESISDITMTGTNQFNYNQGNGLEAFSYEDITLNQVTANGNGAYGAYLEGDFDITMTGTNVFNNNAEDGLSATSWDEITVNQVTANGNGWAGASLWGIFGDVTVTGTNVFNNNAVYGLNAASFGNITVNQVTANGNGWDGASLSGYDVTITGISVFNNAEYGLSVESYGNITLNNIAANGNGWDGAALSSDGNITVTGTNVFNNNADRGLEIVSSGDITLNNVIAMGNDTDVLLFSPGNATINTATVGSLDAEAVCGTLALNQVVASAIKYPVAGEHTFEDASGQEYTIYCDPKVYVDGQLLGELPVVPTQYEFDLSCDSQTLYPVDLPNGDKVTIVCPVSGRVLISRLDNTTIPNDLPAGYTYASAFSVSILQEDEPIPVITEGGHVEVSFQVPSQQQGTYSILFWDNGTWIPLNDFLLGPDNNPQSFALNPGVATDLRTILSGVNLVTRNGVQRVEVSTNFPGVFALAQQ